MSYDPKLWDMVEDDYETPKGDKGVVIDRKKFDEYQKKKFKLHKKIKVFILFL